MLLDVSGKCYVVGFIAVRKSWRTAQLYEVETCLANCRHLHFI